MQASANPVDLHYSTIHGMKISTIHGMNEWVRYMASMNVHYMAWMNEYRMTECGLKHHNDLNDLYP